MIKHRFLLLLSFFLLGSIAVGAQNYQDQPIFSPIAEKDQPYPASRVLYVQYVENGNHYLEQGLYLEAKDLFWKAIHLYPENPDAYVNLGIVHMSQGELESALRILKEAEGLILADYEKIEILFYNLGRCNFLREEYPEAISYFKKALGEFPDFGQARYHLALTYHRLGQDEKAFLNALMAVRIFEQNQDRATSLQAKQFLRDIQDSHNIDQIALANTLFKDARAALADQDLDGAITLIEESLFLNPKADVYYQLAHIHLRKKAFHNAIVYLNKVIEIDPSFLDAYLELNRTYRKVEKYEQAVEIMELASTVKGENPQVYYHMALAYIEDHQFNTARRYLAKAEAGALANKDKALIEEINSAYDLIKQYKQAKAKPPYYPRKIEHKSSQPIYPSYPVSGNAGYLDEGYFRPRR